MVSSSCFWTHPLSLVLILVCRAPSIFLSVFFVAVFVFHILVLNCVQKDSKTGGLLCGTWTGICLGLPKSESDSDIGMSYSPFPGEGSSLPSGTGLAARKRDRGVLSLALIFPESGLLCCSLGEVITYLFLHPFLYFHLLRLMGLPKQHLFPVAFASSCKWACWGPEWGAFHCPSAPGEGMVPSWWMFPAAHEVWGTWMCAGWHPKEALDKPGCPVAEALEPEEILQVSRRNLTWDTDVQC